LADDNIDLLNSKLEVRHLCNKPNCIEMTHLKLGTHKENMYDAIKVGNHISDQTRILSDKDVNKIRKLYRSGKYTQLEIAERYNVTRQHINKIVNWEKRGGLDVELV
jgi:DNA-binding transcriptional regulator YiaG